MVKRKQTEEAAVKTDGSEDEVESEIEYVFSGRDGEEASDEDSEIEASDEDSEIEASDEDSEIEAKKAVKKKKKTSKKSCDYESESDLNEEEASPSKKKKTKTKKTISKTQNDDDDVVEEVVGFADAISRILERTQIPVGKKHAILAKGKTDKEIQKHKLDRLSELNPESVKDEVLEIENYKERLKERKTKLLLARTKPNVLEINKEKQLKAIATQGIVQLFNAVQKQQKLNEETENTVNTTDWKKQQILENSDRKSFFHILENIPKVNVSSQPDEPEPEKKIWNFLKNDFILDSTKMKDWDKKDIEQL